MTNIELTVPNISCAGCVGAIRGELSELPGVSEVSGDETTRVVQVAFDAPATREQIVATLRDIDYPPEPS